MEAHGLLLSKIHSTLAGSSRLAREFLFALETLGVGTIGVPALADSDGYELAAAVEGKLTRRVPV
jgi:hypothetical protein